jgi:hypothetical protein
VHLGSVYSGARPIQPFGLQAKNRGRGSIPGTGRRRRPNLGHSPMVRGRRRCVEPTRELRNSIWASREEVDHRRSVTTIVVGRQMGSPVRGVFRWWWPSARGSERSGATVGRSASLRQGGTMAGGAGQRWALSGGWSEWRRLHYGLLRGGQQLEDGLRSKAPCGRARTSTLRQGNIGGSSGGAARWQADKWAERRVEAHGRVRRRTGLRFVEPWPHRG